MVFNRRRKEKCSVSLSWVYKPQILSLPDIVPLSSTWKCRNNSGKGLDGKGESRVRFSDDLPGAMMQPDFQLGA